MSTALDERYGRRPARRRLRIAFGVAAGVAVAAVMVAWVWWAGWLSPAAALQHRDLGFAISDDGTEVTVRWSVTTEPGTTVSCALQALDQSFEIVGWKVVDLPASDRRSRSFEDTVRTVEQPVTGLIYRCWLT